MAAMGTSSGSRCRRGAGAALLIPLLCLVLTIILASGAAGAQPAVQAGGQWETGVYALQTQGEWSAAVESLVRLKLRIGGHPWRLHADVGARLDRDFAAYGGWGMETELERLYLKVFLPSVDVSLGKQQVSWGVGHVWAPTDVFNPPNPMDPAGLRQGVNAAVVRIPAGPLGYWSLVAAEKDGTRASGEGSRWQYGVRRHGNSGGTDWSLLAVRDAKTTMVGADAKGDLGIGWHGETAWFVPHDGSTAWVEGVLGADHSWDGGRFVWLGEYLYNSRGAMTRDSYDYIPWLAGERKYLARHYAFNHLAYQHDDFTSFFGSVLMNLVDGSAVWTAGTRVTLTDGWQLSLSAAVLAGDEGDEFAAGAVPGTPVIRPSAMLKAQVGYSF